jgi:hypothetical protein
MFLDKTTLRPDLNMTALTQSHLQLSPALQHIALRIHVKKEERSPFRFPNASLESFFRGLSGDTVIQGTVPFSKAVSVMEKALASRVPVIADINCESRKFSNSFYVEFILSLGKGQYKSIATVAIPEFAKALILGD